MIRFLTPLALAITAMAATPAAAASFSYTVNGALIPDNSFTLSTINVRDSFEIGDVDVKINDLNHNYAGDVQFYLSKGDTTVQLFKNYGGGTYLRGSLAFSDEASIPITSFPNIASPQYRPTQALSAFDGMDSEGIWILKAVDTAGGIGGSYGNWTLILSPAESGAPVPEPASWALMILGFGAAGAAMRQRRLLARAAP